MCSSTGLLNIVLLPLGIEMWICYRCYVEQEWLEKYGACVLIVHTGLTLLVIMLWNAAEYKMAWDTKAQESSRWFVPAKVVGEPTKLS
jgi:hypothetical protein